MGSFTEPLNSVECACEEREKRVERSQRIVEREERKKARKRVERVVEREREL